MAKRIQLALAMAPGCKPKTVTASQYGAIAVHRREQFGDYAVTRISDGKCAPLVFYDREMAIGFAIATGHLNWTPDDTGKPVDRKIIKSEYTRAHQNYADRMLKR